MPRATRGLPSPPIHAARPTALHQCHRGAKEHRRSRATESEEWTEDRGQGPRPHTPQALPGPAKGPTRVDPRNSTWITTRTKNTKVAETTLTKSGLRSMQQSRPFPLSPRRSTRITAGTKSTVGAEPPQARREQRVGARVRVQTPPSGEAPTESTASTTRARPGSSTKDTARSTSTEGAKPARSQRGLNARG